MRICSARTECSMRSCPTGRATSRPLCRSQALASIAPRSASRPMARWSRSRGTVCLAYSRWAPWGVRLGRSIDETTWRRAIGEMKRARPVLASILLALGGAESGCNCEGAKVGQLKAAIIVEPMMIDFGDVPLGVKAQGALTVKSAGDAMLTLIDIRLEGAEVFKITKTP